MIRGHRLLAVIPARAGSQGLPGKNTRAFCGLPLIAHSILFARGCSGIDRVIVSTDSQDIAEVARRYGAEVPFLRPSELAQQDTPMWPVLRHALLTLENRDKVTYDLLILLDPTSPGREWEDVQEALQRLELAPDADGVVSVSQPTFNPVWHCVVERDGWMVDLLDQGSRYARRQDVPAVYRINGALYMWRTPFVRREDRGWRPYGKHVLFEIPERRAMSIDDLQQFEQAEALVRSGHIHFPWLKTVEMP